MTLQPKFERTFNNIIPLGLTLNFNNIEHELKLNTKMLRQELFPSYLDEREQSRIAVGKKLCRGMKSIPSLSSNAWFNVLFHDSNCSSSTAPFRQKTFQLLLLTILCVLGLSCIKQFIGSWAIFQLSQHKQISIFLKELIWTLQTEGNQEKFNKKKILALCGALNTGLLELKSQPLPLELIG